MRTTRKLSLIIGAGLLTFALPILAEGVNTDLRYVREDDQLGRDTSLTVYDAWGMTEFSSTSSSERSQMDAYLRAVAASYEAAASLRVRAPSPDQKAADVLLNTPSAQ